MSSSSSKAGFLFGGKYAAAEQPVVELGAKLRIQAKKTDEAPVLPPTPKCPIKALFPSLTATHNRDLRPLTVYEEQWLSTLSNWCTMTLFKPVENWRSALHQSKRAGTPQVHYLFEGLQKSLLNKAIDDCIFMSNIRRINSGLETHLNIKNPSADARGKATVGVLARVATLAVTYPTFKLQDRRAVIRRVLTMTESPKGEKTVTMGGVITIPPRQSLYRGFVRQSLKESVFTATYVLSSGHVGRYLEKNRMAIYDALVRHCASLRADDRAAKRATDLTINAGKAAGAGALATIVTQPFDFVGVPNAPGLPTALAKATRKTVKKASYNFVNSLILQELQATKCHRSLLRALLPEAEQVKPDTKK